MALADIMTNIKNNLVITVGGESVTIFNYDELPSAVETGMLPCRLIMPFDGTANGENAMEFIAMGRTRGSTRNITDLFLYAPPMQGDFQDTTVKRVQFIDAMEEQIRANRDAYGEQASLEAFQATVQIVEYPPNSGKQFFGVIGVHTVRDYKGG